MARTRTPQSPATNVVADICLYGTSRIGAGYLGVQYPHGQLFGTGIPVASRSFTEAIFAAVTDLAERGVRTGVIRIFDAGGERVTAVDLATAMPYYSDLLWTAAPVYTISAEALTQAAK